METKKENSVQEPVTNCLLKSYKANNLIIYNITIVFLKSLHDRGLLSDIEYNEAINIIACKHGLNNSSIFVLNNLI